MINYSYRLYCKQCEDFTLHSHIYAGEPAFEEIVPQIEEDVKSVDKCKSCGKIHESVNLDEIDLIKIEEQQARFKRKRKEDASRTFNMLSYIMETTSPFSSNFENSSSIIETDAGLLAIEVAEMNARIRIGQERQQILKEHRHVSRNDACPCGSGKKYKKCCLLIHKTF